MEVGYRRKASGVRRTSRRRALWPTFRRRCKRPPKTWSRCGAIFTDILSWASWSSAAAGHNAKIDIDESVMAIGAEFLVGVARRFLESA